MEFKNRNPLIYIFAGKARAGKDTCADFTKKYYENKGKKVLILQYSFYLKEYAKKIMDWDGSEESKPRQLLQDLGTDLIRKQIDRYLFVNRIIEDLKIYAYFFDVIIISDARLIEELDMPREKVSNVKIVGIKRPNYENGLTDKQKNSLTEIALDDYDNYDYNIINDGSLEQLNDKLMEILEGTK